MAGPDGIHPKLLIECKDELCYPLTKIFQISLENTELPRQWKISDVVPIYKSGDKQKPENYRPISLNPICSNLMQRIVNEKIIQFMTTNNLFAPEQFGFMKGKSCQLQLLESMEDWSVSLDNSVETDIIFYDIKKAFDTISHNKLLLKLKSYGIIDKVYWWIESFLKNRYQEVIINNIRSSRFEVKSGVPQGSVLGPTLFLIFINDLPNVAKTTVKLFADDTKTYTEIKKPEDHDKLQSTTDAFVEWSKKWELNFNPSKCKRLHIGKKDSTTNYYMNNTNNIRELITNVEEEKDLGVIIDHQLHFNSHIYAKINKANQHLGLIYRNFRYLDKTMFLHLYKSLVRTHLEYASPVWSPYLKKYKKAIENIQRRATRMIPEL